MSEESTDRATMELVREQCAFEKCGKHIGQNPVVVDVFPPPWAMADRVVKFCSIEHAVEEIRETLKELEPFFAQLRSELAKLEAQLPPGR